MAALNNTDKRKKDLAAQYAANTAPNAAGANTVQPESVKPGGVGQQSGNKGWRLGGDVTVVKSDGILARDGGSNNASSSKGYLTAAEYEATKPMNRIYANAAQSNLSSADASLLNADLQKQIQALKEQYEAYKLAGNTAGMQDAHAQAEAIRQSAGYSGGANGAGYSVLGANAGGMTADQMAAWIQDYKATNYRKGTGWTNGYSTAMNVRSQANKIRQQMLANEQAMANADAATKQYLHEQNLALAQLLPAAKDTWYNAEKGRWETWDNDLGYGMNYGAYYNSKLDELEGVPGLTNQWHKQHYGYTDEMIDNWANDTSHYYNFVDTRVPARYMWDESSGYTGKYAQFVNGPYAQLLGGGTHDGSVNPNVYNNDFGDGRGIITSATPQYDANGNLIQIAPELKNNNAMTDYTNQFTSYVANGVIQPGVLAARNGVGGNGAYSHVTGGKAIAADPRYSGNVNRDVAASTPDDPNNAKGQIAYYDKYGKGRNGSGGFGSISVNTPGIGFGSGKSGVNSYEDYINQMYTAALEAQMESLKAAYDRNLSDLDANSTEVDSVYSEQKRQADGNAALQAANWREVANAYGLNSGAIGQAALAMSNQRNRDLNTLSAAQAAAQTEIQRQRAMLGQEYQSAINQALAENNYQRAYALYNEAIRAEELLWDKEKYYTNLALDYLTAML